MNCNNKCGTAKCCKRIRYYLEGPDELEWFKARGLKIEYDAELDMHWGIIPQICPHLKNNLCDIHDNKPNICKEYKCKLV